MQAGVRPESAVRQPVCSPRQPVRFGAQTVAGGGAGEQARRKVNLFSGKSSASYGVPLLNLTVSDPRAQSEVQSVVNAYNDLVNALRRQGGGQ